MFLLILYWVLKLCGAEKQETVPFFPFLGLVAEYLPKDSSCMKCVNICLLFNLVYLEQFSLKLLDSAAFNKIILAIWVGLCFFKTEFWLNPHYANLALFWWTTPKDNYYVAHCTMHYILHTVFFTQALVLYSLYKSICS